MLSLLAARARRPRKPRIKSASAAAVAANFWPLFHEKEAFMAKNEGSLLDWTGSQQRSLNFLPKLRFAKFAPLLHTRSDSNNLGRLKEPWPYFCLSLFSLRRTPQRTIGHHVNAQISSRSAARNVRPFVRPRDETDSETAFLLNSFRGKVEVGRESRLSVLVWNGGGRMMVMRRGIAA